MHSSLFTSIEIIEFQTTELYSISDVNNVKYNMHIHSRNENLNV
jgi:hypothetical protein